MASGAMKREYPPVEQPEPYTFHDPRKVKPAKARLVSMAATVGDEALTDVVTPPLERLLRGDVQIVDLAGHEDKGLVRAIRSPGLASRLKRLGLNADQMQSAVRFSRDFDKARVGGALTANYEGVNPNGGKATAEPERWAEAVDILSKASHGPWTNPLTREERMVLYGYVCCDVSTADLGKIVCRGLSAEKKMHQFTGKLFLRNALNKLNIFYADLDYVAELHGEIGF